MESKIVQRNVNDIAKTQQVVITFPTKKSHEDADLRKLLMNMMFSIRKIQLLVPNIVVCISFDLNKTVIIISSGLHLRLLMYSISISENGNIVVILVVVITSVFFFLIVFCCCCFLETSGEDPERYIVFKNDTLNVSRQMLPKVLENSSSLVFIVSLVEEWRDKILCIENRKNKSVIRCDESGVKIELNGVDINEEANGI